MIVFNQFVPFCTIRLHRTDGFLSTETVGRPAGIYAPSVSGKRNTTIMTTTAIQEEEEEEEVPPIDGRRNEEAIVPPKIELLDASEGFQTSSAGFCNLFNILSRGVARISVSGS